METPVYRLTDTSETITFPRTTYVTVNVLFAMNWNSEKSFANLR